VIDFVGLTMSLKTEEPIKRLISIMALLRDPEKGCPWDVEQTFSSIAPHTIEEAYEVADAIEQNDMPALVDELGDLLLQVVFHSRIAEEDAIFSFDDVADAICKKLVRRHPHVFADADIKTKDAQTRSWENLKSEERELKIDGNALHSALDGVTIALPALTRALKLQKRAAHVGFDWQEAKDVLPKFDEEFKELAVEMATDAGQERLQDELGDLLFTCVNLSRKLGIDPETALRSGNAKFERRFKSVEAMLAAEGKAPEFSNLQEMDLLWDKVKAIE
jgi:ATP diphosphatase